MGDRDVLDPAHERHIIGMTQQIDLTGLDHPMHAKDRRAIHGSAS
jgi:hypothetical protein